MSEACASPREGIRNGGGEGLTGSQPESFSTQKPECLVTPAGLRKLYGSTGIGSKLVLHPGRPGLASGVQEKVVGVENFVAKIFVRFAMYRARAGLGAQINDAAGKPTPLRTQIAGLHLEFLDGILSRDQDRQVDVANIQRLPIEVLGTFVAE